MTLNHTKESLAADDADLSASKFHNVNLAGASFDDVNLSGAIFHNVNFSNVHISDVNLTGMTIHGVLVTELFAAYRRQ
jgi:uncharacterized protein YjbI with pentapeptide repeats